MRAAVIVAVAMAAGAACAQDDPMEAQRCVWQCLYNSPGVESAEYFACVAARCGAGEAGLVVWSHGATSDGAGFHASVDDPATGNRLSLLCGRGRGVFLGLFGPEGPDATLTLYVDGQSLALPFRADGGGYYAAVAPGVVQAMKVGRTVRLTNGIGTALIDVPLMGAAEAIAATEAGCR